MSDRHGIVVIDKAAHRTSTDVVRAVRKLFGTRRVGHAGTLDPDATGVLLVCVGQATKAVPFLQSTSKVYRVSAQMGAETLSDDAASETIREAPWQHVERRQFESALSKYEGVIQQLPPRISARKVDGRRLYERVRMGEDVDSLIRPTEVTVHAVSLLRWEPPLFELEMTVGKGFYVRSLVRDLGRDLASAAHVLTLRRTRSGRFDASEARAMEELEIGDLLPISRALSHLPRATCDETAEHMLRCGQRPSAGEHLHLDELLPGARALATGPGGVIAVCELQPDGRLKVVRGFPVGID